MWSRWLLLASLCDLISCILHAWDNPRASEVTLKAVCENRIVYKQHNKRQTLPMIFEVQRIAAVTLRYRSPLLSRINPVLMTISKTILRNFRDVPRIGKCIRKCHIIFHCSLKMKIHWHYAGRIIYFVRRCRCIQVTTNVPPSITEINASDS